MPALTSEELLRAAHGERSAVVRERVLAARGRQARRGTLNALLVNTALAAHFGHREHPDRSIVNTWIGDRERSEATPGCQASS